MTGKRTCIYYDITPNSS